MSIMKTEESLNKKEANMRGIILRTGNVCVIVLEM